jgi:hypothetical protein
MVEGALGGFVEFSGARFGVGGRWIWIDFRVCFGRIWRYFEHGVGFLIDADTTSRLNEKVAAVRRLVDR